MNNTKQIRYNYKVVFNYLIFLVLFATALAKSVQLQNVYSIVFNATGVVVFTLMVGHSLISPYFIIGKDIIVIKKFFLYQIRIKIGDIETIIWNYAPFSSSYFKLNNGQRIKFNENAVDAMGRRMLDELIGPTPHSGV